MTVEATRLGSGMPPLTVEVASGAVLKLRLKEGRHRLVARAADGEKSELELAVVAGQSTDGRFFFAQPVVNSARLPAAAVPIDVPEAGWSTTQQVGFGTIGLGAAGLAVAMGYGFLAEGRKRSAEAQCQGMDEGQGSGCDGTALEDFKAHTRYIKAVNTLLIAGGVTAATGMGLIVFGGNDATTVQAKLTLTPYWTGASAGLAASGAF